MSRNVSDASIVDKSVPRFFGNNCIDIHHHPFPSHHHGLAETPLPDLENYMSAGCFPHTTLKTISQWHPSLSLEGWTPCQSWVWAAGAWPCGFKDYVASEPSSLLRLCSICEPPCLFNKALSILPQAGICQQCAVWKPKLRWFAAMASQLAFLLAKEKLVFWAY